MASRINIGDKVVYTRTKYTSRPGKNARDIQPARRGESYEYCVDKYWVVAEVRGDGQLVLQTRRGKRHLIAPNDPALRKASWWEKLIKNSLFPKLTSDSKFIHATAK